MGGDDDVETEELNAGDMVGRNCEDMGWKDWRDCMEGRRSWG